MNVYRGTCDFLSRFSVADLRSFFLPTLLAAAVVFNVAWSGPLTPIDTTRNAGPAEGPLTVIAIGDAGESGGILRANASYITAMQTGEHDAGRISAMIFLGDNFYPIGLNGSRKDAEGEIRSVLGPFQKVFDMLGRANVHAVAGNHDYYARNAVEEKFLFGLFTTSEEPVGISDIGNRRESDFESWTYHSGMPSQVTYPLAPGAPDSAQFIFIDSALPLRTRQASWTAALDSLRRLMALAKGRPHVLWHILCSHHPLYSVGEHAGYSVWNADSGRVEYFPPCDRDSNAYGWIKNMLDPEDLCTDRYRDFADSLMSVLRESGVKVQACMAGHDHSLQLLYYPWRNEGCDACPAMQIVSGAGSKTSKVRSPSPPYEYTSAQALPEKEGESLYGFVQLRFEGRRMRVVFFNGKTGDRINMGEGKDIFWIDSSGRLE